MALCVGACGKAGARSCRPEQPDETVRTSGRAASCAGKASSRLAAVAVSMSGACKHCRGWRERGPVGGFFVPAKTLRGSEFRQVGQTHGPKDAPIIDARSHIRIDTHAQVGLRKIDEWVGRDRWIDKERGRQRRTRRERDRERLRERQRQRRERKRTREREKRLWREKARETDRLRQTERLRLRQIGGKGVSERARERARERGSAA